MTYLKAVPWEMIGTWFIVCCRIISWMWPKKFVEMSYTAESSDQSQSKGINDETITGKPLSIHYAPLVDLIWFVQIYCLFTEFQTFYLYIPVFFLILLRAWAPPLVFFIFSPVFIAFLLLFVLLSLLFLVFLVKILAELRDRIVAKVTGKNADKGNDATYLISDRNMLDNRLIGQR